MNIYVALAGAAVVLASYAGTFAVGVNYGESRTEANDAKMEKIADAAAGKVANQAAVAISKLKVQKSTVYQRATHEIQNNTVYAGCRHTDGMLGTINEALTGRANPSPNSVMPATNPLDKP